MSSDYKSKPLAKLTNKEWRGIVIALTFIGVFVFFVALKDGDWGIMKTGLMLTAIGVGCGFVLHYVFGIKIIQLREDFKHSK